MVRLDGLYGSSLDPEISEIRADKNPPEIGFPDLLGIRLDHVLKRTAQIKTPWQLRPCKSNMH